MTRVAGLRLAGSVTESPAVRAEGAPFQMALTAAVVRHSDRTVDRIHWSVRDISRRSGPD